MPSTITAGPDDVTHPRGRMALVARSGVTGEVAVHEALTRWVDDGWRRHARSESTAATRLHRHHGGEYPRLGRTVVEATHATHKPGGGPPTRGRSALPTRGSLMAGNIGLIRKRVFPRFTFPAGRLSPDWGRRRPFVDRSCPRGALCSSLGTGDAVPEAGRVAACSLSSRRSARSLHRRDAWGRVGATLPAPVGLVHT